MSKQPSAPPPGDRPSPSAPPPPPSWRHWLWPIALIATLGLYFLLPSINNNNTVTLTYSQFISSASQNKVKDITFESSSNGGNTGASGTLTNGKDYTTVIPGSPSTQLANQLRDDGVKVQASASSPGLGTEILYWLILLAPIVFVFWLFRRMSRGAAGAFQGALGVGRSRAKVFDAERPDTKFNDVAGYEGAKQEISEIIDFLRNPGRYQRAGAAPPRGVLMVGPPGTGKTLLA
ncbi:MAG: ATP-dependent metallopeptidase FtsH/Yme1/Tma family protein, partial [Nocardiopsaceae bacterium]|nr:ATP-dependent metallopeptidase FtsH/Yme1/Tma family protein [Nocardiopsaceae bacterium]